MCLPIVRRMRTPGLSADRWVHGLLLAGCAGMVISGLVTVRYAPSLGEGNFLIRLVSQPSGATWEVAAAVVVAVGAGITRRGRAAWMLWACAGLLAAWGVASAIAVGPSLAYAARPWCLILVLAYQWLAFEGTQRTAAPEQLRVPSGRAVTGAALLSVVLLIIPVSYAHAWVTYLRDFRQVVTTRTGVIVGGVNMASQPQMNWPGWSSPSMSVLVRRAPTDAVIAADPSVPWQPFSLNQASNQLAERYRW